MNKTFKRFLSVVIATLMLASTAVAADVSPYMTYRSNVVVLAAADGITITNGTFTVDDLSITEGQDPNNYNYVGQVHTLQNGEFTFQVGRSGSESVANWFNSKFSGYNDPSVNGDRTTFDHTAEELNLHLWAI